MGTGWRNWSEILGLNRPIADAMAENVAGKVQQGAEGALGGLAGAEGDFDAKLAAARGVAPSDSAKWTGPDGLSSMPNWAALLSQAGTAADGLARTATGGGLQTLLTDAYGRPRTQGGGILDAALTGSAGAGEFEGLRGKYGNLRGKMVEADKSARSRADTERAAWNKALEQWKNRPPAPATPRPPSEEWMPPPPPSGPFLGAPGAVPTRGNGQGPGVPPSFLPEDRTKPLRPGQDEPEAPIRPVPVVPTPPPANPDPPPIGAPGRKRTNRFGTFGRDF